MTTVLVHGGDQLRRTAVATAFRTERANAVLRVRVSSRAAEAVKCLADSQVTVLVLLDESADARQVQAAVAACGRPVVVYQLLAADDFDAGLKAIVSAL